MTVVTRTPVKEHDMFDLSIIGTRQATELTRAQFGPVPTTRRIRLRPRPAI
jgi:hypothetical protein